MKKLITFSLLALVCSGNMIAVEDKDHVALANTHAKKGNYQESLDAINAQIEKDPTDARAYKIRGHIYYAMGNYEKSMADVNHVVEMTPKSANAYVDRSIIYSRLGKHKEAMDDIDHALEINPRSVFALAVKSRIEEEQDSKK